MAKIVQASPNVKDWGTHSTWSGEPNDPSENRFNIFTGLEGLYVEIINERGYSGVMLNNKQRIELISALLEAADDLLDSYFDWPAEIPDGIFEDEDGWI